MASSWPAAGADGGVAAPSAGFTGGVSGVAGTGVRGVTGAGGVVADAGGGGASVTLGSACAKDLRRSCAAAPLANRKIVSAKHEIAEMNRWLRGMDMAGPLEVIADALSSARKSFYIHAWKKRAAKFIAWSSAVSRAFGAPARQGDADRNHLFAPYFAEMKFPRSRRHDDSGSHSPKPRSEPQCVSMRVHVTTQNPGRLLADAWRIGSLRELVVAAGRRGGTDVETRGDLCGGLARASHTQRASEH